MSGAQRIFDERERQIVEEGYTSEGDLGRTHQLVEAGLCYARAWTYRGRVPGTWPWRDEYWKPTGDAIRDLTKAGALIAAAIDSLEYEAEIRSTVSEQLR